MTMTSMQRTLTALGHGEPDRVPLFLLLTEHGARLRHQGPNGHHELTVDREGFVLDVAHLSYRLR